ncbi:MAG: DUF3306 domain-containing protein [Paracoccaceae bacterium]
MARRSDKGFLSRWSRMKTGSEVEESAPDAAAPGPATEPEADFPEDMSDAEILERLGLPEPDDLSLGDDFKQFLTAAVPRHIKQRALRRLWLSNPVLANLDGLNDYEQDFSDAATAMRGATSYTVGERLARRAAKTAGESLSEAPEAPESGPEPEPTVALEPSQDRAPTIEEWPEEDAQEQETGHFVPRRMRFRFDT